VNIMVSAVRILSPQGKDSVNSLVSAVRILSPCGRTIQATVRFSCQISLSSGKDSDNSLV
jgi:hypothetical protein